MSSEQFSKNVEQNMDKYPKRIEDFPFYVSEDDSLTGNRKIVSVDVDIFNDWLLGLVKKSLTVGLRERLVDGMKEFQDGYRDDLLLFLDKLDDKYKDEFASADEENVIKKESVFVVGSCRNLIGLGHFEFYHIQELYFNLITCFGKLSRFKYQLTKDEEGASSGWIPYRVEIGGFEFYCLRSEEEGADIIAYASPVATAGSAFSSLVYDVSPRFIVPKEAYPLEVYIEDVACILGCSNLKAFNMVKDKKIKSKFSNFGIGEYPNTRVYIYDLMMYIREEYGAEDRRLHGINVFLKELVDGEVDRFERENGSICDSGKKLYPWSVSENCIPSMLVKIRSLRKEIEDLKEKIVNNPSMVKFLGTLKASLSILFEDIVTSYSGKNSVKLTRKKYLEMVKEKVEGEKYHQDLASKIFDCYPKERRAGPGERSRKV